MSDELKAGRELDERLANLLGDDLKARDCEEDIVAALLPYIKSNHHRNFKGEIVCSEYVFAYANSKWHIGFDDSPATIYAFYDNRSVAGSLANEGIDHAIAEYRRTPPAYSTTWEGMGLLEKEIVKICEDADCDFSYEISRNDEGCVVDLWLDYILEGSGRAVDLPAAFAFAAHAAIIGFRESQAK